MTIAVQIRHFFKKINKSSPFLLALSGGGDSACLWHLLREHHIPHQVAHVDHGWREESAKEALELKQQALSWGVPFHLKKLEMEGEVANLEEKARLERLAFFREICLKEGLQGVLMAHHNDDLAETVLKRLFESAPIEKLGGMQERSLWEGVFLLRPLLNASKKQILAYNQEYAVSYFEDATNRDERFLRARLRGRLLPLLSEHFGKEIASSLAQLGRESFELREYLSEQVAAFEYLIEENKREWILDLSQEMSVYLKRQLIKQFFEKVGLPQNRFVGQSCLDAILGGKSNWKIELAGAELRVHHGKIYREKKEPAIEKKS